MRDGSAALTRGFEETQMKNTDIHDVVLTTEGYDILSADTEFYAFIGNRVYDTFDSLIIEDDRRAFYEGMERRQDSGLFLLRLLDEEGRGICFFARIREGTAQDNTMVQLVYAEDIVSSERRHKEAIRRKNAILSLYQDTFFEYDPATDRVKTYAMGKKEQNVEEETLDAFAARFLKGASPKEAGMVRQFASSMRGGTRRFELHADHNLFADDGQHAEMTVRAASLYEEGSFKCSVGYIHLGAEYRQAAHRAAELDSLTGLMAKAEITNMAIDTIDVRKIKDTTLAIVDIDYFKKVNDTFGHMCGDDVLRQVSAIMEKETGDNGVVGRIGGDEFMIIFFDADDMEHMRERLKSIKNMVSTHFPPNDQGRPVITLSIGCASYPKDADNYEDLFRLADFALYRAKEKGRDRYIVYDRAKHGDLEDIREKKTTMDRIDSRGDMSLGDILCVMMDKVYGEEEYPLQKLLDDFVVNFGIQRILLYVGTPSRVCCMAGEQRPSQDLLVETEAAASGAAEAYRKNFDAQGAWVLDSIQFLKERQKDLYWGLDRQGVLSFVKILLRDKNGVLGVLSIESVNRRVTWNRSSIAYYRLFARLLGEYDLVAEKP